MSLLVTHHFYFIFTVIIPITKILVRKETLSYIFADLFQIWLNKSGLESAFAPNPQPLLQALQKRKLVFCLFVCLFVSLVLNLPQLHMHTVIFSSM